MKAEEIWALADRFMTALEACDVEEVRACYAPNARIWHNYDNAEQTVEENLKLLSWMHRKAPERRYRIARRSVLEDGWLQRHVLEARLANGSELALFACCVIRVEEGRIIRIEEYLDPAQTAALRA